MSIIIFFLGFDLLLLAHVSNLITVYLYKESKIVEQKRFVQVNKMCQLVHRSEKIQIIIFLKCVNLEESEIFNYRSYLDDLTTFEPRHEKTWVFFAYAKTKAQISFAVTAKLIRAFVFPTRIVQFLFYLNRKFQVSSHLLWLYNPVCVGPGLKSRRPVFSQRGSFI